ncbi:fatty-acyl-CoA synthase [Brevibacterium sanguinis]|uniref:Fatty-acyl-CoA synthase n=2 Tax=Brevibacterium TaxID=1696 RepID=A0A366IQT6_9MICO|nr:MULTISPECIES: AMP-binding protein [Brevibacterium]RBP68096.1 fatty-acyl-CoA synthase [Brevibacterium sanguinis]RBP74487.1 fatty-acyl-CoA synthase [Brevibacterium celere]
MTIQLTIDHLLWRMHNVHPESQVVTVNADETIERRTFAESAYRIEAIAHALREKIGLSTGDVVTVFGWNDREHFELLLAVPLAGGVLNSVNLRLGSTTMPQMATDPRPKAVVFSDGILDHASVGEDVRAAVTAAHDAGATVVHIGPSSASFVSDSILYDDLLVDEPPVPRPSWVSSEDQTAFLFHTSGTTGAPKSYPVSHRAALLHCLSEASVDATGLSSTDRMLPLAPFFHVNGWGLPLTCALTGASLVLAGSDVKPARMARLMDAESVTVAAAVPSVWFGVCAAIANGDAPRPSRLREVLTGGDALPESVWNSLKTHLGVSVATAWGMTETMSCSTYERDQPAEHAGKPIPLVELRLEDASGQDEDSTVPGRLQIRGPFVIGDADPEGWFTTGDIATISEEGTLTLRDREKDLIKSGGEWIASAEIEQRLCAHPAVAAAAVVPVSDPRWIQRPRAYVVLADPASSTDGLYRMLSTHLAEKFPRWWLPDQIEVVDALPTTTVGKINKRALRQMAETTTKKGVTLV